MGVGGRRGAPCVNAFTHVLTYKPCTNSPLPTGPLPLPHIRGPPRPQGRLLVALPLLRPLHSRRPRRRRRQRQRPPPRGRKGGPVPPARQGRRRRRGFGGGADGAAPAPGRLVAIYIQSTLMRWHTYLQYANKHCATPPPKKRQAHVGALPLAALGPEAHPGHGGAARRGAAGYPLLPGPGAGGGG